MSPIAIENYGPIPRLSNPYPSYITNRTVLLRCMSKIEKCILWKFYLFLFYFFKNVQQLKTVLTAVYA